MKRISTTRAATPQIKPAKLRTFHACLAQWYAANGRHNLPWRNTNDPYHIWLSEVMLQQTQVATVRDRFYSPFLQKFPTVEALAAAPTESVMKAWEGLGYYTRARNLQAAAQRVVAVGGLPQLTKNLRVGKAEPRSGRGKLALASEGGASPPSIETLLSLPGIGRNTAHAILAFAYHQPVAILEANVKRVVARIFAWETPREPELWAGAEALLNRDAPFNYNQAMMDVGALVCTPKNPNCAVCPARNLCEGKANPTAYPAAKPKKITTFREVIIDVQIDARGHFYLEKRDEKLLGGLYGFPQSEVLGVGCQVSGKSIRARTRRGNPPPPETRNLKPETFLDTITHVYSHFTLIAQVYFTQLTVRGQSPHWHSSAALQALPLSMVDRKVLALVEKRHTGQKKLAKASTRAKHG